MQFRIIIVFTLENVTGRKVLGTPLRLLKRKYNYENTFVLQIKQSAPFSLKVVICCRQVLPCRFVGSDLIR